MSKGGGASRPRFRLLPTVLLTAAILLLPTAVYAWGRTSNTFSVKRVEVSGTDVVSRRQVLRLLRHDYLGRNLFTVTTAGVQHTLVPLAYVGGVQVDRAFPDLLSVRVVEYQPALFAYAGEHWYVVAVDGRVICEQAVKKKKKGGGDQQATGTDTGSAAVEATVSAQASDGTALSADELRVLDVLQEGPRGATLDLPRMAVAGSLKPGTTVADAGVRSALVVIAGLSSPLREDVAVAEASGDFQLTLRFAGGPLVVWGDTGRSQAKTLALRAVLLRYQQAGKRCSFADVSVPDRVLARPVLK